jgi:hypothetical protein
MSYLIKFDSSRKSEVFDNVKRFILLGYSNVMITYLDGTEEKLENVLGITDHHYNDGVNNHYEG